MILTRLEKERLVLDLHNQGKGTREIAREVKISFSQIGVILKRASQQREVGQVHAERISISTQAYDGDMFLPLGPYPPSIKMN